MITKNDMAYTKAQIKNMITVTFMMAFFTVFWAIFMLISFLPNIFAIILFAFFIILSVYLIIKGIKFNHDAQALPDEIKQDADIRAEKRWNIIFITQCVAICICCALLGIFDKYGYIIPVIMLINGLHYFPLGMIYRTPIHFVVAVPVTAISLLTMIFLPPSNFISTAGGISSLAGASSTSILGVYMIFFVKNISGLSV